MKKTISIWAAVFFVLWTAFIFARSLRPAGASNEESGRLLLLLQQLFPFELTNHLVRKAAHVIEYAVLGLLGRFTFEGQRGWERSGYALVACLLVALCDETIQLFVEGRAGMVADIWLDMAGVCCGVLAGAVVQILFRRLRKNKQVKPPG